MIGAVGESEADDARPGHSEAGAKSKGVGRGRAKQPDNRWCGTLGVCDAPILGPSLIGTIITA